MSVNLHKILLLCLYSTLILGCDGKPLTGLFDDSSASSDVLSKVTAACSTTSPEGLPFTCTTSPELDSGENALESLSIDFEIIDSDCDGLSIGSDGVISGVLELPSASLCSFKVQAQSGDVSVASDTITVTGSAGITFSFDTESLELLKGGSTQTVNLVASSPLPFDTEVSYEILGFGFHNDLSEWSRSGTIPLTAGSTVFPLEFTLPSTSSLTGTSELTFVIKEGAPTQFAELKLLLSTSTPTDVIAVGAGDDFTCFINSSGELYCMGTDQYGTLGQGSGATDDEPAPVRVGSSTGWTNIVAGTQHACGIDAGVLYCWGRSNNGETGTNTTSQVDDPTQVGTDSSWTEVTIGNNLTCGIESGRLYCWGSDTNEKQGNGTGISADALVPVQVGSLTGWTDVSAGDEHVCGIESGNLYCWGLDTDGQLGNGPVEGSKDAPFISSSTGTWTHVDLGSDYSCGIDAGALYCWGEGTYGSTGLGSFADFSVPTQVGTDTNWTSIHSGYADESCGIESGRLFCWGLNNHGILATGSAIPFYSLTPLQVGTSTQWTKISVGLTHACGIKDDDLYCWGDRYGSKGATGVGFTLIGSTSTPQQVSTMDGFDFIHAKYNSICALRDGKLYCWGDNSDNQIGDFNTGTAIVGYPVRVGLFSDWETVSGGRSHTCGIRSGSLYCWGDDTDGEVGNGSASSANVTAPEKIGVDSNWTDVSSGFEFTCGIESGRLFCWGNNSVDQLGSGGAAAAQEDAPLQIGVSTTWTKVELGKEHACGIDAGALYCWGSDATGQQGNGATTGTITAPTQVGSDTNWTDISLGEDHTCGIESSRLFCWGGDSRNQIGDGPGATDILSPLQIGVSSLWTSISAGDLHTCGIENGSAYCWGYDGEFQMGTGPTNSEEDTPLALPDATNYISVIATDNNSCGIKTDGTIYCWGWNTTGQIGIGAYYGFPHKVYGF
tara:strand:- start:202610 stop:205459 length:2850 start_codon:yes stop_codon:yes gene_type:complete